MRELAILSFVTLDGVMQSPTSPEEDPSGGFAGGGWGAPYWDEVMPQVYAEAMSEPYDLLFGRRTYDVFASHWPSVGDEDPVAARLNGGHKYVATRSEGHPLPWGPATRIGGDVGARGLSRGLKAGDGPLIQVHGSSELIQTLLAHDLIDEFQVVDVSGRGWGWEAVVCGGDRAGKSGVGADWVDGEWGVDVGVSAGVTVVARWRQRPSGSRLGGRDGRIKQSVSWCGRGWRG